MNKHALLPQTSDVDGPSAPGCDHRYWAFLSYSHADSAAAERLHRQLELFRVPRPLVGAPHPMGTIPQRLIPIFRDRQELAASSDLGREIKAALEKSRYFIVLCSPEAARSPWVEQEVRDFKRLHGEDRVLAAIVGGEPFAADESQECFPQALRQKVDPNGKLTGRPAEPIAADLRESGDGWPNGVLKLIAGMLDVGLDDLVQREQTRRQKRTTAIVAASLAGMAFTTGLSVVAINARDAARDERREAEGMVGFMLGDLKAELEPIGRLDALDQVGARALTYYERQDKKSLTDDQLTQRSKALTLLGQIAFSRGQADAAQARYREALRGTAELVERDPSDPQRLFDHAQNIFWMGELDRRSGRIDRAEAAFREYAQLAARMVAADPSNLQWQLEVEYARENIGIVKAAQRKFGEAATTFQRGIGPLERLVKADPTNRTYRIELATMLAWLADARRDEGKLEAAIAARRRHLELLRRWLASGQKDASLQQQLVPSQQGLGILLTDVGNAPAGIMQLRQSVADAETLLTIEPTNMTWKGFSTSARLELARTLLDSGRIREAADENSVACTAARALTAPPSRVSEYQHLLTTCLDNASRLQLRRNDALNAVELARQALDSAQKERSGDATRNQFSVVGANRLLGDAFAQAGDLKAARSAWMAGADALPTMVAERPREIAERATLYDRLGNKRESRELIAILRTMGFTRRIES